MAAANKPTAVHFSLVFFVMASLILGEFTYLGYRDLAKAQADLVQRDADLSALRNSFDNRVAEITELKTLLGYNFDQLGAANDATTVIGALNADMQTLGGDFAANTLKATSV